MNRQRGIVKVSVSKLGIHRKSESESRSVLSDSFATTRTIQSMEFSRPEYWSGSPFPSPGDRPNPGIEPRSPTLQEDSSPAEPPEKPPNTGVGSLSLLQGIFLTQELNRGLLHCRQILYQLSCDGSPWKSGKWHKIKKLRSNSLHSKESNRQCRRPGFSPWRREWQPTPVFLLGGFHGQRSLVGCSPWGRRESHN